MQKLAADDPTAIVSAYHRGEGVPALAARYGISRERVYQILRYTREHGSLPVLQRPGRRPRPPPWDAVFLVLGYRRIYQLGPRVLSRRIARETTRVIPHTMVYRILRERGLITAQKRRPPRPKWVRFERKHAMTLWQGDWKQVTIDGTVQWLIAFLDDASRFITCWGLFPSPTTEATILVLETGFARYGVPNEIDGSRFSMCLQPEDRYPAPCLRTVPGTLLRSTYRRQTEPSADERENRTLFQGDRPVDRGRLFHGRCRRLAEQNQTTCEFGL